MLVQFKHIWLIAMTLMVCGSSSGLAQSFRTEQADLNFEIINATTGQPGTVDRLMLQYSSAHLSEILDIQPTGSQFEVPAVPIQKIGKYVLTTWSGGVPYYRNLRGRNLLEGPVKVHVFDTRTGIDDVTIVGLNLLIQKTESLLQLEYMLQVENTARPQVSLVGGPHVIISLPEGAEKATLIYGKGPDPLEKELQRLSGGMFALEVPLTTGHNKMRLKTTLHWQEELSFPIGANVPIQSWSLMATPMNLDIQAFDLIPIDEPETPGYLRLKGPVVAENEAFNFRISSSKGAGDEENLFTHSSDEIGENESQPVEIQEENDKGFPFVVLTPIFVVILVIVVSKRRRS